MKLSLNVGGVTFETTKETLQSQDGFLKTFAEQCSISNFIDRDPTYFIHILNYLRNSPYLPNDIEILKQLQYEADFYCLMKLKEEIINKIYCLNKMPSLEKSLYILSNKLNGH